MNRLTAILCLTLAVLLGNGSANASEHCQDTSDPRYDPSECEDQKSKRQPGSLYKLGLETDDTICFRGTDLARRSKWAFGYPSPGSLEFNNSEFAFEAKRRGMTPESCLRVQQEAGKRIQQEKSRAVTAEKQAEARARQVASEAKAKQQQLIKAQTALKSLDLYDGKADGFSGPKTNTAINRWLKANGLAVGTALTEVLVARMALQVDDQIARRLAAASAEKESKLAEARALNKSSWRQPRWLNKSAWPNRTRC
jgi:hypothetical protein